MPQKKVPNKPVQISLDPILLKRIDADAETRTRGRSAFIISAVLRYLREKERERVDGQFQAALQGREAKLFGEVESFSGGQAWPAEDALVEASKKTRALRGRYIQTVARVQLQQFVGTVGPEKMRQVCRALMLAAGCD